MAEQYITIIINAVMAGMGTGIGSYIANKHLISLLERKKINKIVKEED